jgi:phosphohistidine phosphatase SixA
MITAYRLGIALLTCLLAAPVAADEAAFSALREPGAVAVMRHALAPGTGDPAHFRLDDCATQRNLDARGRAQARATGEALRAAGIEVDRVLTSAWCRCRETAELLALAPVEVLPALNSFFQDRSTRDAQTTALRAFLDALAPEERVLLVTHQVNISALAGRGTRSGEVLVLARGDGGDVTVRGSILIAP